MNIQININKGTGGYPPQGTEGIQKKQISDTSGTSLDTTLDRITKEGECACEDAGENAEKFSFEKGMIDMFTSFMTSFKEMMKEYMSQIKQMVAGIVKSFKSMQPPSASIPPKEGPEVQVEASPRKMESFAERVPARFAGHIEHGHVNEADLQAAVVSYKLYQKSEDAEHYFLTRLEAEKGNNKSPSEALKAALIATQEAGKISKLEAEFVYSLSFRAAQIDENLEEVSEAPHGAGTMDLGHAVKSAEINLAKVIQGKIIIDSRALY
jgi:hypothetical protein